MERVKDLTWKEGKTVGELVESLGKVGFQSIELGKASEIFVKMKRDGAKVFFSFTSNMVTSGLRGFFAQLIKLGMAHVVVTTTGGIEEDIMKASGDEFLVGKFRSDDVELHEKGMNRVGNLLIPNDAYVKFEGGIGRMIGKLYRKKKRYAVSEFLREIGLMLDDEDSILYQAAKNDVPIFCPAITDGALGFHLFMFQQEHPDFIIDVVADFRKLLESSSYDEKKAIVALGGGVSKHHAILGLLLNGGAEYAVYMTTAREVSGSMGAATTDEAKSWGKVKDDSDAATVNGDVSLTFPLAMMRALDILRKEGMV
jgi:deoxyhypusine synthase